MDPASLKNIHCYKIIHKQTEVLLDVKNAMTLDTDSKFVILSTSSQEPGANYEVSVAGVKDISGVIIDPTKSKFPILGRGEADTIPPVLYPPCRIIGTENFSKREPIKLIFSEIMDTSSTKGNVPVKVIDDSAKIPLQGKCRCKSLWEIEFTPLSDYQSLTSYTVVIDSMLSDLHGNRLPKSERIIPFKTPDYFLMGSIEGSIQCSSSENQVVIELKKNEKIVRNLASKCGGQYEITDIALVSYLVKAFVDLNRNGTWDPPDFRGANPGEPIKFKNVEFLEESGIKSYTLNFVFELQEENLGDE
jgi:hypothetical protein